MGFSKKPSVPALWDHTLLPRPLPPLLSHQLRLTVTCGARCPAALSRPATWGLWAALPSCAGAESQAQRPRLGCAPSGSVPQAPPHLQLPPDLLLPGSSWLLPDRTWQHLTLPAGGVSMWFCAFGVSGMLGAPHALGLHWSPVTPEGSSRGLFLQKLVSSEPWDLWGGGPAAVIVETCAHSIASAGDLAPALDACSQTSRTPPRHPVGL